MPLTRLDKILVDRKLVSSRVRAEQIIEEFGVLVEGKLITKTGKKFDDNIEIQLISEEIPWVSKGALKLLAALEHWKINPTNKTFIDLGASTGGFTEVLLSQKAKKVYCVDVGTNQLHPKLKDLPEIINLEKTHVRELTGKLIPELVDGLVVDVSFISLEKVIPFVHPFLKEDATAILLIKPQFEVGKGNLNKHGIVTDTKLYTETIERIKSMCALNQLEFIDFIESPILGGDGNREFLSYFRKLKTT
jgi:23S rRNA (cytidine1920-2'-O)/16S rRNA (cytidine1409-2'-O)-methyltransferase